MMRAYEVTDSQLRLTELPIPKPQDDEVLIKVAAIGLNRADILQIDGRYPSPDGSSVPGLEVSGVVDGSVDKVCALLQSGGLAEYVCAKKAHLIHLPNDYGLVSAAGLPEALATCYLNLIKIGQIYAGQKILIHGGSSGIGSMAIQIAAAYGLYVVTSVSNDAKSTQCQNLGANEVINYNDLFEQRYKNQFDIVLDILGGDYVSKNLTALKPGGKLISIAVMAGKDATINVAQILMKNLTVIGSTLRPKPDNFKAELIHSINDEIMPLIYSGKIRPVIDSISTFGAMDIAINRMKSRSHFGKILITL